MLINLVPQSLKSAVIMHFECDSVHGSSGLQKKITFQMNFLGATAVSLARNGNEKGPKSSFESKFTTKPQSFLLNPKYYLCDTTGCLN